MRRDVLQGLIWLTLGVIVGVMPASARPLTVPMDPAQSVLNFQLCISGQCDTDWSGVTGTVSIALNDAANPTQISLYDFDLDLTRDLQFDLSWSILGAFHATLTNGGMLYPSPGTVLGPVGVAGGAFVIPSVPVRLQGTMSYTATGVACTAFQLAGRLCSDTQDLANQGIASSDWNGTVGVASHVVTLVTTIDSTSPLDPSYPDLGTLHVWGTVRGSVALPWAPGDMNCDGAVNNQDIDGFVLALFDPASYATQYPSCDLLNGDFTGDAAVNNQDIDGFIAALFGQ